MNIQLFIKTPPFQLFNDDGLLGDTQIFTLYGMLAESEIRIRKERFLRKRKENMSQGRNMSGKVLFGYKKEKKDGNNYNELVKDEENAELVLQIFTWYLKGIDGIHKNPSIRLIAEYCHQKNKHPYTHSKRNINKLLKEEGYTGYKITNNKRKNPFYGQKGNIGKEKYLVSKNEIKYPPIVPEDTFKKVQEKLKDKTTPKDKKTTNTTILSNLIKCTKCNRSLGGNYRYNGNLGRHSYRCTSRTDRKPCGAKSSYSMKLVDEGVWSLIRSDLKSLSSKINEVSPNITHSENLRRKERVLESINTLNESRQANKEIIKKISKSKAKQTLLETLDDAIKEVEKIENKLNKLNRELISIEQDLIVSKSFIENVENVINSNIDSIEKSKKEIKKYVNHFIDKVHITGHNKQLTVIVVTFKYFSHSHSKAPFKPTSNIDSNYMFTQLVVDRKITRKPKYYKAISSHSLGQIKTMEEIENYYKTGEIEKYFKVIKHYRLDVYNKDNTIKHLS